MSKNSFLIPFYKINACHVTIFTFYTNNNKHETIKISYQTKENLQVLSQVLVQFCCWLYENYSFHVLMVTWFENIINFCSFYCISCSLNSLTGNSVRRSKCFRILLYNSVLKLFLQPLKEISSSINVLHKHRILNLKFL